MPTDLIPLSASRLATYDKCSYVYYGHYVLKLPRGANDGSRRGTVCHAVFECLLNPRHKKWYNLILERKNVRSIPTIDRFIRKVAKREGLVRQNDHKGNHNYDMIEEMIIVGLKYDFFCSEGALEAAETEFNYVNDAKTYRILGKIDKMALTGDNVLGIWDYKTSAEKYEGEELENNIQAKVYSLYALRVRKLKSFVKFVFVRHGEDPYVRLEFSEKELEEFERFLEQATKELTGFNLERAYSNFAADKGYQDGFKGLTVCGARCFSPDQLKKDGKKMWHCEYKFPYTYWALCDNNDAIITTSKVEESLVPDESKGQYVIKKLFKGCPRFRHLEYSKNFLASKK